MALAHKGLAAETVPWRFTEKAAIAFSGQGLVPVITDGGRVVHDSWRIAVYLEETYPDRPPLFAGAESRSLAFFFKHWCERAVHGTVFRVIVADLFRHLHAKDQAYFRETRERRLGQTLESLGAGSRGALLELRTALDPVRPVLLAQPFLCGMQPAFADYILFGEFQWARAVSPVRLLDPEDPLFAWRERMLDLHGGMPRAALGYPVWA